MFLDEPHKDRISFDSTKETHHLFVSKGSAPFDHVVAFPPRSGLLISTLDLNSKRAILLIQHQELLPASFELLAAFDQKFSELVIFPLQLGIDQLYISQLPKFGFIVFGKGHVFGLFLAVIAG